MPHEVSKQQESLTIHYRFVIYKTLSVILRKLILAEMKRFFYNQNKSSITFFSGFVIWNQKNPNSQLRF
jgi:hypothetical protein